MRQIVFALCGTCGLPAGTTAVDGFANHFRLPGGQIISIQPVVEMESAADADDHRDLPYAEAIALDLTLECEERTLTLHGDAG